MSQISDEIREELRQRNDERGSRYWMEFDETQAVELAAGYVPLDVRAGFLAMLSWMDEDKRAAAREEAERALERRGLKEPAPGPEPPPEASLPFEVGG